jgi:predicted AlkP superfamily phosphohydrolase/phosphomutase
LGSMRTHDRRRQQLLDIFAAESARTAAFRHLSASRPTDFRMIVYGATDQVQHHFWHFMDESHDKYEAEGAKLFGDAIRHTYMHIDRQLGQLLEDCDENTIVIVMSDHGFGPMSNVRLRLNQVLRDSGLLKFEESAAPGRFAQSLAGWADRILRSTLSSDAKRMVAGMFPKLRVWFENLDEAKIDWSATNAYVNEAYRSSPAVWLNGVDGRQNGELDGLRKRVEGILKSLIDPATGAPVISRCYRPHDLYHGPHTLKAPDLLPSWWEDGFLLEQSVTGKDAPANVERSTAPIQGGVEFAASHRLDGVLMMSGGPVLKDYAFEGARIIDVAPTVLYLMGLPIPSDMDGQVLSDAISDDFLAANPAKTEDVDGSDADDSTEYTDSRHAFSEEESDLIAKRLQALGYIK